MSVTGFTPPRAELTSPSTADTSSGSLTTKELESKRLSSRSCSAVAASTAELVTQLRQQAPNAEDNNNEVPADDASLDRAGTEVDAFP